MFRYVTVLIAFLLCASGMTADATPQEGLILPIVDVDAQLVELLKSESSILDAFWAGDDGAECGEPEVQLVSISFKQSKIFFEVIPGIALDPSCEQSAHDCEVSFTQNEKGLVIKDSPVYPLTSGCTQ